MMRQAIHGVLGEVLVGLLSCAGAPLLTGACASGHGPYASIYTDAGGEGYASTGCTLGSLVHDRHGHSLNNFCAPPDPGPGAVYVSASGETLSLVGFPYPPQAAPDDTWMVDGWNFQLEEYITVFARVTLWTDPDLSPGDQSMHGSEVAELAGPFVVDLHKGGVLAGQGGSGEQATPIGAFSASVLGSTCASTACAFGFSTIAAPSDYRAFNVNLDSSESDDYAYMVAGGYSVLYVGTATWMGNQPWNSAAGVGATPIPECTQSSKYDFSAAAGFPQTMKFRMGFNTPTNYINCQNGSEFPGQPGINGEDYPRGIQTKPNESVPAQVTIHMDHPFWESFAENSPLHWDPIAAQYIGRSNITVHTEDLNNVNFAAFTDSKGRPLPFRNCSGSQYMPLGNGQMFFDSLTVPVCIGKHTPAACLGSYYDYIRYTQSTQGHLNSQGFCFVDRQYPAPGGSI